MEADIGMRVTRQSRGPLFCVGACVLLSGIGLVISLYLMQRSIRLSNPDDSTASDVCSSTFGVSCDATLQSSMSRQIGIPLAGWGVVFYGVLTFQFLLAIWLRDQCFDALLTFAAISSLFALLASTLLLLPMLLGIVAVCPFCLLLHAINAIMPFAILGAIGPPRQRILACLASSVRFCIGRDEDSGRSKWQAAILLCPMFLGLVLYQLIIIWEMRSHSDYEQQLWQKIVAHKNQVPLDLPTGANTPRLGPETAPVQLVVFSDFRCESCRRFTLILDALHAEFPEGLCISFRHYPADPTCNSFVSNAGRKGACEAAQWAEAARHQKQFWPLHDWLFRSTDAPDRDKLRVVVEQLGMQWDQFISDADGSATRERIIQDIELAHKLKVDATPTVFLNGVRVKDLRHEFLRGLISLELADNPGSR